MIAALWIALAVSVVLIVVAGVVAAVIVHNKFEEQGELAEARQKETEARQRDTNSNVATLSGSLDKHSARQSIEVDTRRVVFADGNVSLSTKAPEDLVKPPCPTHCTSASAPSPSNPSQLPSPSHGGQCSKKHSQHSNSHHGHCSKHHHSHPSPSPSPSCSYPKGSKERFEQKEDDEVWGSKEGFEQKEDDDVWGSKEGFEQKESGDWLYLTDKSGSRYSKKGFAAASAWLRDGLQVSEGSCVSQAAKDGSPLPNGGSVCFGGGSDRHNLVTIRDSIKAPGSATFGGSVYGARGFMANSRGPGPIVGRAKPGTEGLLAAGLSDEADGTLRLSAFPGNAGLALSRSGALNSAAFAADPGRGAWIGSPATFSAPSARAWSAPEGAYVKIDPNDPGGPSVRLGGPWRMGAAKDGSSFAVERTGVNGVQSIFPIVAATSGVGVMLPRGSRPASALDVGGDARVSGSLCVGGTCVDKSMFGAIATVPHRTSTLENRAANMENSYSALRTDMGDIKVLATVPSRTKTLESSFNSLVNSYSALQTKIGDVDVLAGVPTRTSSLEASYSMLRSDIGNAVATSSALLDAARDNAVRTNSLESSYSALRSDISDAKVLAGQVATLQKQVESSSDANDVKMLAGQVASLQKQVASLITGTNTNTPY